MILVTTIIWQILIYLTTVMSEPQCGIPCIIPMVHMAPPPPPMGIPIPVAVPIPVTETTTTCTTKKEKEIDLYINSVIYPVPPWPFTNKNFTVKFSPQSAQFAYPVPPSLPMGFPIAAAPPVVMIPFPPVRILERKPVSESSDSKPSSSDTSSSDNDSDASSNNDRRKKKHYGIYRRSRRNNIGEVKPMLTYLSEDGQVIYRRHLSERDEKLLMNENDPMQKVEIVAGEDKNGKSKILVVAKPVKRALQNKNTYLKSSQRTFDDGKEEIVFKPSSDKKISNLSVTFNMEK